MSDWQYGLGEPFIDVEEWRDAPRRHRYVHGGFEGTHTRFSLYLPPEDLYRGRFFQYLEGGSGGHENTISQTAAVRGGWLFDLAFDELGGYLVESNQGHFHNEGLGLTEDVEMFGASAESARYGKLVAQEMYGSAPHHGYVWGPSGGGLRTIACITSRGDVYDGASPHVIGGNGGAESWSAWAYWWLHCRTKVADIVDACEPGGSGDPWSSLSAVQRDALATLYRRGWPRGAENQLWSFSSWLVQIATHAASDPTYVDDFWSLPGYAGHDELGVLEPLVVDHTFTVDRAFSIESGDGAVLGEMGMSRAKSAAATAGGGRVKGDTFGISLQDAPDPGRFVMAKVTVTTGRAAGRSVYIGSVEGDTLVGFGQIAPDVFDDVEPGDEVHIDNRDLIAFAYRWRHVVHLDALSVDDPVTGGRVLATEFGGVGAVIVDGTPIYPQRGGTFGDERLNAEFDGKMIHVVCSHDSMVWPAWVPGYERRIDDKFEDAADEQYRIWWVENASHGDPEFLLTAVFPEKRGGVWRSRLVDYNGVTCQALRDLVRWVEEGVAPPNSTSHSFTNEGGLQLPDDAETRGGVQPVVRATANGGALAAVKVGEPVTFSATAHQPPGTGSIVNARWDFAGTGDTDFTFDADDESETMKVETQHAYDSPGTYFASFRVAAHRDGASGRGVKVENLARVRVVVT